MDMLQFYQSILTLAGMVVNKDGTVSIVDHEEGKNTPMTIKGRRLVIPTKEQMQVPDWSKRVAFHPLSENVLKGESDVFSRFRTAVLQYINITLASQASYLLDIAASTAQHAKLSAEQTAYLLELFDVDAKCVQNFGKLLAKVDVTDATNSFVKVFMKRGGELEGTRYSRVAVVSFPMYEALVAMDGNGGKLYGVDLRKKDVVSLTALIETLIPNIAIKDYYSSGSNDKLAPYTVALLNSVAKLTADLNDFTNKFFSEDEDKFNRMAFRDDWVDLVADLTPIINQIRLTPNQDPVDEVETKATKATGPNTPLQTFEAPEPVKAPVQQMQAPTPVASPVQPMQMPVQQPAAPAPSNSGGGLSVSEVLARAGVIAQPVQQPMQQPMYGQPPVQQGWGQPTVNQWGQPIMPQQQPMVNGWPMNQLQPGYGTAPIQPQMGQPQHMVGAYGYPIKG